MFTNRLFMTQIRFFLQDVNRMLGKHKIRIIHIWLSRSFAGIFMYRLERSLFLIFGKVYGFLRILFLPIIVPIQAFSNVDIHYKANIKGGLLILHPSIGCVISGKTNIGRNLTLTGGNIVGVNKKCDEISFLIGDNCTMGANATIIGPVKLGNNIRIGASACVVKDCSIHNSILVGVPAKILINGK